MIEEWVLNCLACPACAERPPLTQDNLELVCTVCGARYPIRDGIPILIIGGETGANALANGTGPPSE